MALSADLNYTMLGSTARRHVNNASAADILYKGAIINFDANGLIVVASDTANHKVAGIVTKQVTVSGVTPVEYETGVVRVAFAAAQQSDVGKLAYATADDTIALSLVNGGGAMGVIEGFEVGVALYINMDRRTL